jgi:hypothetical protein
MSNDFGADWGKEEEVTTVRTSTPAHAHAYGVAGGAGADGTWETADLAMLAATTLALPLANWVSGRIGDVIVAGLSGRDNGEWIYVCVDNSIFLTVVFCFFI